MKLFYEVDIDHEFVNGDLIFITDTVEYEVDDFDIVCVFSRKMSPSQAMGICGYWSNASEEQRKRYVDGIMKCHRKEIEDYFRNTALEYNFSRL